MAASQKISELTTAGPLTGAELVPIVQSGGTLQTTVSAVAALAIVSLAPVVSALATQIDQVSAAVSAVNVRVDGVVVDVAALDVRLTQVSSIGTDNTAAIVSVNDVVSVLTDRVADVSAVTSVNAAAITSVNAVVSTKAFRDNDHLTNVQYLDFNTTTSYAPTPGRLTWDIESGTLDLGLTGTVNLLIGQRTVAQVYNNSGVTLPKGKAVRVTGAQGQRLTGALAQADSDADSLTIFGIMLETVSVNRSGYVATDGLVRNVNTLGYTDGTIVYLSPVSAGELTPTKPVAPQHLVQMGYIVKGGSGGAGEIYVKVQNGYELGELHDVKTSASTSLSDGEVLAYNVSAKVWTNSTALISAQASISALNVQVAAVSALASVNAAAITSINNVVSAVEVRVSTLEAAVSAIGDVSAIAALVSTVAILGSEVSVLTIRVSDVSAATSANAAAITSVGNIVSAQGVRLDAVSVATSANAASIVSVNAVVSALDTRVGDVSAAVSGAVVAITSVNAVISVLDTRVAAVSASVSALQVQLDAVSAAVSVNAAAITSINNVVSALEIRVSAASATGVTNAAAITSINNVVSALEVRVSSVSAVAAINAGAITSVNVVVSALQTQVNAVSVSVAQRVLKAGDTMTGALTITTSADQQGLTVDGRATFSALVSISAGTYTGLQNYQDNTLQRATFRDYALILVARGSVSATATLDLLDGNFFQARAAGSTTFVFANPPVSAVGTGGAAGGFILELQNGGAATITWPSTVRWPGGTAPTLTSSGFDVFVFITDDGGTNWRGVQSMRDSK